MKEKLFQLVSETLNKLELRMLQLKLSNNRNGRLLDLVIDKLDYGKVTLHDCELASKQILVELNVNGMCADEYSINVSSPGIDRPLFTLEDYIRFIGNNISITSYVDGLRKMFYGTIENVINNNVIIKLNDNITVLNLKLCDIIECKLDILRHLGKSKKLQNRKLKKKV